LKENLTRLATILFAISLMAVPTLAFPGQGPKYTKYTADLTYNGVVYGKAVFNTNTGNGEYELEVEVENCAPLAGSTVEVYLHQDYYNMILIGNLNIDSDGNGESTYETDLMANEFTLLVQGAITLSTENGWQGWTKPHADMLLQASPGTLNQKSNGNWVTLKTTIPSGSEVTDLSIYVNGVKVDDYTTQLKDGTLMIKLSRATVTEYAEPGQAEITLTFSLDGEPTQLSATILVMNPGEQALTSTMNTAPQGEIKDKKTK
jgi:hypothetical protein